MNTRFTRRVALLAFLCASWAYARDIAVVTNKENGVKVLSQAELVKIAQGTLTQWPDGQPITLIIRIPASPAMRMVAEKLYEMAPPEINDLIYTANRRRPDSPSFVIVNSDEAVLKKVMTRPGAIGLVDVYSITAQVQVVRIGGKLPLEHGYLLHENQEPVSARR
jgi:ABC-type phosphate transport system substrate-binding protein